MSMGWQPGPIHNEDSRWAMDFTRPFDTRVYDWQVSAVKVIVHLSIASDSKPIIYTLISYTCWADSAGGQAVTFVYDSNSTPEAGSEQLLFRLRYGIQRPHNLPIAPYRQLVDMINFTLHRIAAEVL